jgi:hypothetical protein
MAPKKTLEKPKKTLEKPKKTLEKRDNKGLFDRGISKLVSRKLMVWATATVALFTGVVPAEQWLQVCLLYIGSQACVDMIVSYKNAGK